MSRGTYTLVVVDHCVYTKSGKFTLRFCTNKHQHTDSYTTTKGSSGSKDGQILCCILIKFKYNPVCFSPDLAIKHTNPLDHSCFSPASQAIRSHVCYDDTVNINATSVIKHFSFHGLLNPSNHQKPSETLKRGNLETYVPFHGNLSELDFGEVWYTPLPTWSCPKMWCFLHPLTQTSCV